MIDHIDFIILPTKLVLLLLQSVFNNVSMYSGLLQRLKARIYSVFAEYRPTMNCLRNYSYPHISLNNRHIET